MQIPSPLASSNRDHKCEAPTAPADGPSSGSSSGPVNSCAATDESGCNGILCCRQEGKKLEVTTITKPAAIISRSILHSAAV